jgi:hypothetical protein
VHQIISKHLKVKIIEENVVANGEMQKIFIMRPLSNVNRMNFSLHTDYRRINFYSIFFGGRVIL